MKFEGKVGSFPLCSNDYVLRELDPTSRDQTKSGGVELYLTPPLNSHKIVHTIEHTTDIEFFCHSDNSKIIRIVEDTKELKVHINLYNYTNLNPFGSVTIDLVQEGLVLKSHLDMANSDQAVKGKKKPFEVIVSRSGEFGCIICENVNTIIYKTFSINIKVREHEGQ